MSASKKRSKKQILRQHIASTISKNLIELKEALGEKKFNRNLKKASKVLAAGFPKNTKGRKSKKAGKAESAAVTEVAEVA